MFKIYDPLWLTQALYGTLGIWVCMCEGYVKTEQIQSQQLQEIPLKEKNKIKDKLQCRLTKKLTKLLQNSDFFVEARDSEIIV